VTAPAWRPPAVEPGALETVILAAVRRAILPSGGGTARPDADGVARLPLADGREVQLRLAVQPTTAGDRHGRAVLRYHVSGQGLLQGRAFLVEGEAVLDRVTRAFLEFEIRLAGAGGR
jgi:hypothetical protein